MKVAMTGGVVRINTHCKPLAAGGVGISDHHRGTAIVCADRITVAAGATTHDASEAHAAAAMVANAQKRRFAADGSKIGIVTFARMARLADIHDLVTVITAPPPPPPTRCRRIPRLRTHHTRFDPTFVVWAKKSKINTAVLIDHRQAKNTQEETSVPYATSPVTRPIVVGLFTCRPRASSLH
jgi:DeoR C terminal sensor domain